MSSSKFSKTPSARPLSDFPDLLNKHILHYDLRLSYFKEGLDPSIIIQSSDKPEYIYNTVFKDTGESAQKLEKVHILYLLLSHLRLMGTSDETRQEVGEYFKEQFTRLYKEGKIPQHIADETAFLLLQTHQAPDLFEHLIKAKVVDINTRNSLGQTFLMQVQEKYRVDLLVSLGIDVNAKINNAASVNIGKTVYDLAMIYNKKGLISYLKPHVPQSSIESHDNSLLHEFTAEKNIKKQMKIFMASLKSNNSSIIDEISNNQEKYNSLIEYKDGHGKNLLRHCISNSSIALAPKVMQLDYYQKNKHAVVAPANLRGDCYCSYAVNINKLGMAKLLFGNGFYVEKELIEFFEDKYYSLPAITVFNLFLDTGYNPSLAVRWKNESTHKLEEKLNGLPATELAEFIKTVNYMLDLKSTRVFNNGKTIVYEAGLDTHQYVPANHVRFFCKILQAQRVSSPTAFEKNFKAFLTSLNYAPEAVFEYFTLITLTQFPNDKNKILSYLQSDKPFVIKLQKDNLEKVLEKFEAQEVKKFKI